RRSQELCRQWKNDRGIRFRCLPCGVPLLRSNDVHRQRIGSYLRKGSWSRYNKDRRSNDHLRPGFHLAPGAVTGGTMNFHIKSASLTSAEPGEFIMKLLKQSL